MRAVYFDSGQVLLGIYSPSMHHRFTISYFGRGTTCAAAYSLADAESSISNCCSDWAPPIPCMPRDLPYVWSYSTQDWENAILWVHSLLSNPRANSEPSSIQLSCCFLIGAIYPLSLYDSLRDSQFRDLAIYLSPPCRLVSPTSVRVVSSSRNFKTRRTIRIISKICTVPTIPNFTSSLPEITPNLPRYSPSRSRRISVSISACVL